MLQLDTLKTTITNLVKGKSDIILYGNKSSGKTTLVKNILDQVLGKDCYVHIKCIFVCGKQSLFYLIGDQIMRLIKHLDSRFVQKGEQKSRFMLQNQNQSLQSWFKSLNQFIGKYKDFFEKLPRIYFFIDNIQEMSANQHFIKQFYNGLKKNVKYVKISLFFCGYGHRSVLFTTFQPFRNIPIFIMPRPQIKQMIQLAVKDSQLQKIVNNTKNKTFIKLLNHVKIVIYSAFESIQYKLQNIYLISKSFLEQVHLYVQNQPQKADLWLSKNQNQQKILLKKLTEFGPVTLERTTNQNIKNNLGYHEVQQGQATFYMENYPNLIMTSVGLANGYLQTQDVKRFIELKKPKGSKRRGVLKKFGDKTFKFDEKKIRHNEQRIISISEIIQQQSQCHLRLKQRDFSHHTLDYYGCIQYLRQQGELDYYGKCSTKFGGKIIGQPKQSEVKDYLKKLDVRQEQFCNLD